MEPFTEVVGHAWRLGSGDAPLCRRLEAALRAAIAEGRLAAGAPLPSERALAAGLSVSRITVRKAMQALEEEGDDLVVEGLVVH